jgi:amino acid adenylation domain-containing protein/non-ribosomal peptide synthase protein (TIGR01720 family)
MDARRIEAIYPVSPFQEALLSQWVEAREDSRGDGVWTCSLRGHLDFTAFEQAWGRVASRHPVLRTSFVWKRVERPVQVVHQTLEYSFRRHDWRQSSRPQQEQLVKDYLDSELRRCFDPSMPEAVGISLCRTADDTYHLICSYSRLLLDERSVRFLMGELFVLYDGLCRGEDRPLEERSSYRDYIAWLGQQDLSKAAAFWKTMLEDFSPPAALVEALLPDDLTDSEDEYGQRQLQFSPSVIARWQSMMAARSLAVTTLLQGAWALLLSRYSGEQRIVLGLTISTRSASPAIAETMLGPLTNTLPLLVKVDEESITADWLAELQARQLGLRPYEYNSLDQIRGWINQPGEQPLFESSLILDSAAAFPPLSSETLELSNPQSLVRPELPLRIEVLSTSDPTVRIAYRRRSFDDGEIERRLRHLETILETMVDNPAARIGDLPLLSQAEQREILIEWNRTESKSENRRCLHELIEERVEAAPEAVALIYEEQRISYRELDRRANRLAHYLRALGVGPETRVGLYLNRGLEVIVAILGVLKAGATYVPLDPAYPLERLAYMLEDAQVIALISERELLERLPSYWGQIITIDADCDLVSRFGAEPPIGGALAGNPAYIIYTSGSTGRPKGVIVSHRSVANRLLSLIAAYGLDPGHRILQFLSLSFDAAAEEIFLSLLSGAGLVLHRNPTELPPDQLIDECDRLGVTILHSVPTYFDQLANGSSAAGRTALNSGRLLIAGGESFGVEQVEKWMLLAPRSRVVNAYGPTEATITSTVYEVPVDLSTIQGARVPIGKPVGDTQTYILNEQQAPVPVGVAGELCISGVGLARGYLNRADLTAERFIPNPFNERRGERMYRTGDLCRYRSDGKIDFIGRRDRQVKLKGHRIELGEIEAVLTRHSGVGAAAVIVSDEESGNQHLVALVVPLREPEGGAPVELSAKSLRLHLKEGLPDHMIPARFMIVDALPLMPSGKIDRKRLPMVERSDRQLEQGFVAPRTPVEETLVEIFKQILRRDRVGVHDNFFELGGDSILSIQIIARANEAGLGLTPKHMFQHQSIAELAAVAGSGAPPEAEEGPVSGEVPLTPIQEWFFEGHREEPEHYNQAIMLEAMERLEVKALRVVLDRLAKHHDVLRHSFQRTERRWRQVCDEFEGGVTLEEVALSGGDEAEESAAIEAAADRYQRGINLETGPLMKVVVFETGGGRRQRVLIIAHHLVIDGVSWRILLGDLERGYQQASRGQEIQLGARTTSYQRWAERLKAAARSERARAEAGYWLRLEGQSVRRLPVDETGENTVASSRGLTMSLDQAETEGLLQGVARAYKAQIHEVVLSAVARAISEWSKEPRVLVEMEGHGREEEIVEGDLTRTLGWFTSIYPVKVEVGSESSVELLRQVKEEMREAGRRSLYYGLLRYGSDEAEMRERMRGLPQAEISFNYLGQLDGVISENAFFQVARERVGETRSRRGRRRHVIEINGSVSGGSLSLLWTYSENLHRRVTIESIAARTMEVLREVVAGSQSAGVRPYTPSDFPLVRLNQQRLDQLIGAGAEIEDLYRLSPLQRGMLFHTLSGLSSEALFEQLTCNLRGEIDFSAFKQAWLHLVRRHAILRTAFKWEALDEPLQVVHRRVELPIEFLDWRTITAEEQERRFGGLLRTDRERGFDLSQPPLMRWSLIRLTEDRYRLIWSHHHLLLDGWSSPLVLQEVFAFYEASLQGTELEMEPRPPYKGYIEWLSRRDMERAETHWREALKGFNQPTRLWIDRAPGRTTSQEGVEDQHVKIDAAATSKLQAFARQHHLTMNTILQGAWGLLLSKYSGEADLAFGITVSGRPVDLPGSESIIGPFINTLPVRMRVSFQTSILAWLSKIQSAQLESGQYAYSSLPEQYGEIPLGVPLYESILIFENYPLTRSSQNRQQRVEIDDVRSPVRTKYPLTIVSGPGSELQISIAYDPIRFDRPVITRLLAHLRNIIEEISNDTAQPVSSLSLLSPVEQGQLLAEWAGVVRIDPEEPNPLHQLEALAERIPDVIAVVCEQKQLSYRELNRRSNQLAHELRSLGMGPEVGGVVCLESSPALVVALLGVVKAGGVGIVWEPSDREDHFPRLLPEPGASVILIRQSAAAEGPELGAQIVRLDSDWGRISGRSAVNPDCVVKGENSAFITYTSSSTGEPKRVLISHRGWRNYLFGMQAALRLNEEDRVLQTGQGISGGSIGELFWPLLAGARLVLAGPEASSNVDRLSDSIAEQEVTITGFTPSICSLLLRADRLTNCKSLRQIVLSGEPLSRRVAEDSRTRLGADISNVYGLAEASGAVTISIGTLQLEGNMVPVVPALENTQVYILDPQLQPVPVEVAGEVWIAGEGLARGYLDRPDLTAECWIPDPFAAYPGARMFRTKDLARCLPEGKIGLLTRCEDRISFKFGHLEPASIESALLEHPGIDQAALLLTGGAMGARLTLYLACKPGAAPTPETLRRFLGERFPARMIPSAIIILETLPLTVHGRIDRSALAIINPKAGAEIVLADRGTPYEQMLGAIWADLFGLEEVRREDNFFEMGGHSLLATQMMSRVRDVFKVEVPLRSVFEESTLGGLARRIEETVRTGENRTPPPPLVRAPRDRKLPLSFAQQRLWFIEQLEPGDARYNCPVGLRLEGRVDLEALEGAINEIVRRHEVLRTRIKVDDGIPVQVIDDWQPQCLETEDLSGLEETARETAVQNRSRQEATTGFDLSRGPLLRVRALKLGADQHVLLLTMHHVVSDAWSMGLLVNEVVVLYQAFREGRHSPLPELKIQYADYAYWQRNYLRAEVLEAHLQYWKKQLGGKLPVMDLALDHPRPPVLSYRGAAKSIQLSAALCEPLKALSLREGATLFMVLLAAFKTLLFRYTAQEEIIVGTAALNRNRAEIEPLIGFFVNMLPMRTNLKGNLRFRELLERVKEVALGAYAHQELPFERLVEELQPERGLGRTPFFNVAFGVQNAPRGEMRLKGLKIDSATAEQETVRFDLSLWITEGADGLRAGWIYSTELLEEATIIRMHGHFETLLSSIVARPHARLDELEMLSEAERAQQSLSRASRDEYNQSRFRSVKPRAIAQSEE